MMQNQIPTNPQQHSIEAFVGINKEEETEVESNSQRFLNALETFILDVFRAYSIIWSMAVWPMMLAMIDSATDMTCSASPLDINKLTSPNPSDSSVQTKEVERIFAERFKYLVCTSSLLTKNLSISSYDQAVPQNLANEAAKTSHVANELNPLSTLSPHQVSVGSATKRHLILHLNEVGRLLSNATCIAIVLLGPLTRSQQGWFQSAVFLISLTLGTIATFGLDKGMEMSFEVSHKPTGKYTLSQYDARVEMEQQSEYLSIVKANNIKNIMCIQVTELIKSCKGFDVECNNVIAAVQEVELVSRGFKLSYPLPPISRIEANAKPSSPPRIRNGSWQSPTSVFNTARLSRSSSSGASAANGPKHHGQSILFSERNTSPDGGRSSPQEVEAESYRLATLRKGLVLSFEDARKALESAIERLEPLIDKDEMELLKEMYEVDLDIENGALALEPSTITSTTKGLSSSEKRSSWLNTARLRLDDEQPSSPTLDGNDRPSTPQRFHALYDGAVASGSARKRDSVISETWSAASPSRELHPIRTGSRLGYVSDKSATTGTPNQSAESKRLSYISPSPIMPSPVHSNAFPLQQISPAFGMHSMNRKRASLLGSGILDELKQSNSAVHQSKNQNETDIYLIASLKSSFEKVHTLRRRVFCQFLALEFSLRRRFESKKAGFSSTTAYWAAVSQIIKQLTSTMSRLALDCTQILEKEISLGKVEETAILLKERRDAQKQSLASIESPEATSHQDFTGMEDRLTAMGQALRSIQVKMIVCAQEMKVKSPPTLHGTKTTVASSIVDDFNSASQNEKAEKVLETIREDLLMLSAEWESALKIIRSQRSSTPTSVIGDTTASTLNSSRLDSPQEAEEDALRQWVKARRGVDESSDSEDERAASRMIENGMLQWTGVEGKDGGWQDQSDLSDLLVKTASPEHLPPPGLEKIYESMGNTFEARRQKSEVSREERIRLAKEERAAAAATKENGGKINSIGLEASSGMIQELQAVMKNRKSINGDATREFKGIDTSNTSSIEDSKSDLIPAAAKRAPVAF